MPSDEVLLSVYCSCYIFPPDSICSASCQSPPGYCQKPDWWNTDSRSYSPRCQNKDRVVNLRLHTHHFGHAFPCVFYHVFHAIEWRSQDLDGLIVLQSLHCLIPSYVSGATSKFDIVPLSVYERLLGQVTSWEKLFCSLLRVLSLSHVVLGTHSGILCFSCVVFGLVRGILRPLLIRLHTISTCPHFFLISFTISSYFMFNNVCYTLYDTRAWIVTISINKKTAPNQTCWPMQFLFKLQCVA